MRQALFAVVLVAASFAGGAVVNGPGLRWAQNLALGRMGLDDDADKPLHANTGSLDDGLPTHPIAPLAVEPSIVSPGPSQNEPKTVAPALADGPSRPPNTITPDAEPGSLPGLPPVPETASTASAPPTRAPIQTPPMPSPPALALIEPPAPLSTSRERDRAALNLASATAADATIRPVSLAGSSATTTSTPPAGAEPADWAGVRKALRALGVSRYGTDAEPNGQARFHCVIPLAGRRAVGQHFEAEGDDELQAARAALRRVTLWRATEAPNRTP